MPTYKLCYFNARGLAEMSRLLFAEAGVEYEDCRITDWPSQKPKMPFGKMPVLFVDGEAIANSRAMVRYLTRTFKLEGGCNLTAAKIDAWIETLFETFKDLPFSEKDEAKRKEKFAAVLKDPVGPLLEKLDALAGSTSGDYIFGKDITALDFVLLTFSQMLEKRFEFKLDNYASLAKCAKAISERPKIAAWLKARPVTEN